MKRKFIQTWMPDTEKTYEHVALLGHGFHYVWDEVQPEWLKTERGWWKEIPEADEVYVSATTYSIAAHVAMWAKKSPSQKFIIGGPAVYDYSSPLVALEELPSNFIMYKGNIEDLIGVPHRAFKLVPPQTDNPVEYGFPYYRGCTWGKCTFCTEGKRVKGQWNLNELNNGPAGIVSLSNPSMDHEAISELSQIDVTNKELLLSMRATRGNYQRLEKLAKLTNPSKIHLKVGVEFPSNRMLQYMNKNRTVGDYSWFIPKASEVGYKLILLFITAWGNLVDGDLEEAKRFFDSIHHVPCTKAATALLITNACSTNFGPLGDPVVIGPFMLGHRTKLDSRQVELDNKWLNLLKENGLTFAYCYPRTRRTNSNDL